MKVRFLKMLLGTERPTADYGDYIAVGSGYVHDLIKVNKKTLKMHYALTFPENSDDREYLVRQHREGQDLLPIWDKLAELVKSGDIRDIIEGHDDIPEDKRVTIFLVDEYKVIETYGDVMGWPNTTFDGRLLYDNLSYTTRDQAVSYAIKNAEACVRICTDVLEQRMAEVKRIKVDIAEAKQAIAGLTS